MGARRETEGTRAGRGLGHFDGVTRSHRAAGSPGPPSPQAGPWLSLPPHWQALWHRLVTTGLTQAAALHIQDKLGCSPEEPAPAGRQPSSRAGWMPLAPRGPRNAKASSADTWSSAGAGPGGWPQGGGQWEGRADGVQRKGRRDTEPPKIQLHRKRHPPGAVPRRANVSGARGHGRRPSPCFSGTSFLGWASPSPFPAEETEVQRGEVNAQVVRGRARTQASARGPQRPSPPLQPGFEAPE